MKNLIENLRKDSKVIIHKTFGLDLGTTNSAASIMKKGVSYFVEDGKKPAIPSIVVNDKGNIVVGAKAKNMVDRIRIKSIKRLMGKDETVTLDDDKVMRPEEVSAEIISHAARLLNEQLNTEPNTIYDRVIITVPAYFDVAAKDATRRAAEIAGLEVIMLLEEPTSAAIDYTVQNNLSNGLFLVYDLGGGTFDVSIVEIIGNVTTVHATAGDNFLGGDNFDNLLANYFLEYLKNELGYDINLDLTNEEDLRKYKLLVLAAENVKKSLSSSETTDIAYFDIFRDSSCIDLVIDNFKRETFEELLRDKIEKDTIRECDKALELFKESNESHSQIDRVILVGGSCKIPFVQKVVKEKYVDTGLIKGIEIFNPDLSVAAGAGISALSSSMILEDIENSILAEIEAPYSVDNITYVNGKIINGQVDTVGIICDGTELLTIVNMDNTFIAEINQSFNDLSYKFYLDGAALNEVITENELSEFILPTPMQNETIRIEIVDLESNTIIDYPLVERGTFLPSTANHEFKTNEYSSSQIILPIKEGYRDIYRISIDVPEDVSIGSTVMLETTVDINSKIDIKVQVNGEEIQGNIEYASVKEINEDTIISLDEYLNHRLENIHDDTMKEQILEEQSNIKRELEEASRNQESGHFSNVVDKYEQLINNLPSAQVELTDDDFDFSFEQAKDLLNEDSRITESQLQDECHLGKRALSRNDIEQAKEHYEALQQYISVLNIESKPMLMLEMAINQLNDIKREATVFSLKSDDLALKEMISNEIREIDYKLQQVDIDNLTGREAIDTAVDLFGSATPLFQLMSTGEDGSAALQDIQKFRGRVSKA